MQRGSALRRQTDRPSLGGWKTSVPVGAPTCAGCPSCCSSLAPLSWRAGTEAPPHEAHDIGGLQFFLSSFYYSFCLGRDKPLSSSRYCCEPPQLACLSVLKVVFYLSVVLCHRKPHHIANPSYCHCPHLYPCSLLSAAACLLHSVVPGMRAVPCALCFVIAYPTAHFTAHSNGRRPQILQSPL